LAMRTCVSLRACRSSRRVISSAINRAGAGLDFPALHGAQFLNYVVHVGGHDYLLSLSSRARWASKQLSALGSSSR
jgi:hypothetical protein